jgi:hypothetical protein
MSPLEACALACDEGSGKHICDTIVVLPLQEDNYVQNRPLCPLVYTEHKLPEYKRIAAFCMARKSMARLLLYSELYAMAGQRLGKERLR